MVAKMIRVIPVLLVGVLVTGTLARAASAVDYIGGTTAGIAVSTSGQIEFTDPTYFAFYSSKAQMRIPYSRVNLIEYGQQVDRRLALAGVISPVFLLSKSRRHFLTIGYEDEGGKQQAMVFRVDKNAIRPALVSLEARTGLKVKYQDQEARKAGN
jgi:hypothetical protein